VFVEGFEGEGDLGCIELGLLFTEFLFDCKKTKKLSSGTVFEDEV
jgi:hypothetical protein